MSWIMGRLVRVPDSGKPPRLGIEGQSSLHCGEALEIRVQGHWLRGRVEYDDRLRWYWTDNQVMVLLRLGMEARQWDGIYGPHGEE